jgi:hypothetical protein
MRSGAIAFRELLPVPGLATDKFARAIIKKQNNSPKILGS